jgi:Cys-tRNA(Pro)/Cys-tRNA(Cys) deacylase
MPKSGAPKTNAMRALDARHIPYATFTYNASIHSADAVAPILGLPPSRVFKTLVVLADRELDLRLVARSVGAKSAQMAPQREAERLTGLKVGGISPLALLDRRFEVYLDTPGAALEDLYINGGQRGVNLRLRVADLLVVTSARVIEASHPPASAAAE